MERAAATLEGAKSLRLYPPPQDELLVTDIYTDLTFPTRAGDPLPYTLINMVSSVDGATDVGGKAGGIGSSADRLLMDALRSRVDAVMIGAGTLRAEKLTLGVSARASARRIAAGLRSQPLAVVIAGSSDPSRAIEENLISAHTDNTLVFIPERLSGRVRHGLHGLRSRTRVVPEKSEKSVGRGASDFVDLRCALLTLRRDYGVRQLLVEGGPGINASLIAAGLVCEFFVTLSPKLLRVATQPQGGDHTGYIREGHHDSGSGDMPELHLASSYLFESELFLRYTLSPRSPSRSPSAPETKDHGESNPTST